jgi:putative ABC transport system permease protein
MEGGIGSEIYIGSTRYTVVGKLEKKGKGLGMDDEDNGIVVPVGSYIRQFGNEWGYDAILVSAYNENELDDLEAETRQRLRITRNLDPGEKDNFGINRQDTQLKEYEKATGLLWGFVIGIGALSLLVGGIGVMNIMLISVTERTREIGLRKAVGAKRAYITLQFLLEALTVCWIGGVVGIALGIGISWGISLLTPVPFALNINSIYIGFIFTTSVGLFFGIYPAIKASMKDPVVALRYE